MARSQEEITKILEDNPERPPELVDEVLGMIDRRLAEIAGEDPDDDIAYGLCGPATSEELPQ